MKRDPTGPLKANAADPYFDPVRDRRMSELTQEQQGDARELWLIQQIGTMQPYYQDHLQFLLDRIAALRAHASRLTMHLAHLTYTGEFASWLERDELLMPMAAAKELQEARELVASRIDVGPPTTRSAEDRVDLMHSIIVTDVALKCRRCGATSAELPTECPGRALGDAERAAIEQGQLDYVGNAWVTPLTQQSSSTVTAAASCVNEPRDPLIASA